MQKGNKKLWVWSGIGCLAIILIMIILLFSACNAIINYGSNPSTSNENSPEEDIVETNSEVVEMVVGTKSNPVPYKNPAIVNDWIFGSQSQSYDAKIEVLLDEVIRGEKALDLLLKENQFNDKPDEGYEWALVKIKGKVLESETDSDEYLFSDISFEFVSQQGETYEAKSAVVPDNLHEKLYNGAEGEGYILNQVKTNDNFLITFDDKKTSPVFFSTQ